ncbi:peptidoglycan/LPS O-acetylase OafA/YrhL [Micromonospora pisi]|uniref:Peptidoglycan/LPS O-acetylase OafA/YrhL n=1 Tax=Micromonospora pisi TaxID=589240 RepID=A0A495JPX0_9ACTN|nr:acyltransferase family protein [Micromonospora pisi]RKR91040.1 peptidoglycan/LPS O-acetylase OafA/YrhL [Micromonospora pisi]
MTQLASRAGDRTRSGRGFRGDIEGMRALAVVLVLLFHIDLAVVPGGFIGVDVFFVISGFLITGLLLSELERTGKISLVGFYARRAKRLLPAAVLVLAASLLLTYLFLPRTRWLQTGWDVVASGSYVMNWRLATQAVDYLAANEPPSILQHYWSLAVEEQFYLLWPLLLILVGVWAAHRWPGRLRRRLLLCLGLVAVASFAWSVHLTQSNPESAFFVTTTRVWELAVGGGLAILSRHLVRLPRLAAVVLGWAGLGAIVLGALLLTEASPFPGYRALVPTLGAAALIAAGTAAGQAGPGRLLSLGPIRAVGALSYSLYLWHWPLLVAAEARFGELGVSAGLVVVLLSVALAWLTYRYVENPVRRAKQFTLQPARALQLGLVCTVTTVVMGLLFPLTVWPPAQVTTATSLTPRSTASGPAPSAPTEPLGAAALGPEPRDNPAGAPVDKVDTIFPAPLAARKDLPDVYDDDCLSEQQESEVRTCVYGKRDSDFTVALAGDSHAAQWLPTLQEIAEANGWRVVTYIKAACPLLSITVARSGRPNSSCTEWNRSVRDRLTGADRPKLLVTSSSLYSPVRDGRTLNSSAGRTALAEGFRQTWSAMAEAKVPTIVLQGTPQPGIDIVECVSTHADRLTECTTARDDLAKGVGPIQAKAAEGLSGVHLIGLNDAICPTDRCAPVIGGMLVYRDTNHLTASYARSLSPRLRAEIDFALS